MWPVRLQLTAAVLRATCALAQLINPAKLSQMVATLMEPLGLTGVELTAMFYARHPPRPVAVVAMLCLGHT